MAMLISIGHSLSHLNSLRGHWADWLGGFQVDGKVEILRVQHMDGAGVCAAFSPGKYLIIDYFFFFQ